MPHLCELHPGREEVHSREFLMLISVWLNRPVGGLVLYIIHPKNKHLPWNRWLERNRR